MTKDLRRASVVELLAQSIPGSSLERRSLQNVEKLSYYEFIEVKSMCTTSPKTKLFKRTAKGNRESTFEPGADQHNPAKQMRNRVPPPQRERILQKHVLGKSITDISKEEHRNRETVSKIVRGPEMQNLVREMRERLFGLAPDAISAVEHALAEQKDGRLAFQLLSSIGVIPSPEEKALLIAQPTEAVTDEDAGAKKIIADLIDVIIERGKNFGCPMPELEEKVKEVGGRINWEAGKLEPLEKKTET